MSMKKVGILTLNGYVNYGNRLQNYALQEVIKNLGFEVNTIRINRQKKVPMSTRLNDISNLSELFAKIINRVNYHLERNKRESRKKIFIEFSRKYINETKNIISTDEEALELNNLYDFFITGSDQVWNPNNLHGTTFYFLTFADKYKRISYAPSFGISEIDNQDKSNYKKWLSEMEKVSVREDDGARIIKELTGREAPVLVDPTLLLPKEQWLRISNKPANKPEGKYLLTYFLGKIPNEYNKQIKQIAKLNNLRVVNLGNFKERESYLTGPSEFIDFINDCTIFCTDSFHGAVFSIILEKPFIIYERIGSISMYSRINTLLNKFDLNSRKAENIKNNEDIFNVEFEQIRSMLLIERKKSLEFLKDGLKVSNFLQKGNKAIF